MARGSRFRLVEEQGYSERDVYEAEGLEEMYEFLEMKTGGSESDDDDDKFFPDVNLL